MSFGPAAASARSGGFPKLTSADRCPCGSGGRFGQCCGPALGGQEPLTAEALMRSRYTAFVVGDAEYLRTSWHPSTCPDDLALDPGLRWVSLEIVRTDAGGPGDARGVVEFRARWREGRDEGVLHESSRFVRVGAAWRYLDGHVT